jgi:uncharacterized membrane protein YeiB
MAWVQAALMLAPTVLGVVGSLFQGHQMNKMVKGEKEKEAELMKQYAPLMANAQAQQQQMMAMTMQLGQASNAGVAQMMGGGGQGGAAGFPGFIR